MDSQEVKDFLSIHLTRRITATLFTRFFDHILSLPAQVLNKWDTGSLTARFEENETVLNTMSSGALTIVMNSFSVIVYTPILIAMNPRLACITIFFCICIFSYYNITISFKSCQVKNKVFFLELVKAFTP